MEKCQDSATGWCMRTPTRCTILTLLQLLILSHSISSLETMIR
jgi:hypothetical protein